jgi:heterotetrameric sarcosine oxidase gamma subunit
MSHLDFLSPDLASADAVWRSPLERALAHAHAGVEDLSRTGVLEVRGELNGLEAGDAEVVRLTPERALVLCPFEEVGELRRRLGNEGRLVVDVSAGWAGLGIPGDEALLRRVTDVDLGQLPAVGSLAHVRTILIRPDNETFRVYFPQEYADYVAEVLIDAAQGLQA